MKGKDEAVDRRSSKRIDMGIAGDAFDGVLFCTVLFPTRCLR